MQTDQLLRKRSYPIGVISGPTKVHPRVAAIGATQVRERLREGGVAVYNLYETGYIEPVVALAMVNTRYACAGAYAAVTAQEQFWKSETTLLGWTRLVEKFRGRACAALICVREQV